MKNDYWRWLVAVSFFLLLATLIVTERRLNNAIEEQAEKIEALELEVKTLDASIGAAWETVNNLEDQINNHE